MTKLALLLESSTCENIIGTHSYKKALDRVEWTSSQVAEEVIVQVPFNKQYGRWYLRQVLFQRSIPNQASDTLNFSHIVFMQNEVLLHWYLVPRLSLHSVNLDVGWKKCDTWETVHWRPHWIPPAEPTGKQFQISSGSCSSVKCTRPCSVLLLFFKQQEQL